MRDLILGLAGMLAAMLTMMGLAALAGIASRDPEPPRFACYRDGVLVTAIDATAMRRDPGGVWTVTHRGGEIALQEQPEEQCGPDPYAQRAMD